MADTKISWADKVWNPVTGCSKIPNRWNKGRGYTKFYYTYADIAQVTGLPIQTIRKHVSKKRFIPGNLKSLFRYLLKNRPKRKLKPKNKPEKKAEMPKKREVEYMESPSILLPLKRVRRKHKKTAYPQF